MMLRGLFLFLFTTTSAEVFSSEQTTQIEKFVTDVLSCYNVPGLGLAVVRGNQTWTKGFGMADLEKDIPVDKSKTLFGIGSLTKAFTVTQIAMLLSESNGRYTWNSKLTDILGSDFRLSESEMTKHVTLKDILTHRTGLLQANIGFYSGLLENITRHDCVRRMRYLPSHYGFRDRFDYNNWMYVLAGYVVEVLSGEPWERNLYRRILWPLGMNETKVLGYDVMPTSEKMAQPYFIMDNEMMKTSPEIYRISPGEPAGGIASSADDMAKWLYFVIHKGETTAGERQLNESYFDDMFGRHSPLTFTLNIHKPTYPITDDTFSYGYAWFIGHYREFNKYWHSGGVISYLSWLTTYPDFKAGVFVTENGPGVALPLKTIVGYISDILIGEPAWLNSSTACTFPEPWTAAPHKSDNIGDVIHDVIKDVHKYIGTYGNRMVGDLTVNKGKDDTSLLLMFGRFVGIVKPTSTVNKFLVDTFNDLRMLTHFGNTTRLIPAYFKQESSGQFQVIELDSVTFRRSESDSPSANLARLKTEPHLTLLIATVFVFRRSY